MNKYEEALSKYVTDIDDAKVKEEVKKIIAEKVPENDNLAVKRFLMGSIELTTLKTTDSEESVMAFTEKVNAFDEEYPNLPHVATICVRLSLFRQNRQPDIGSGRCGSGLRLRFIPLVTGTYRGESGRDSVSHQGRRHRDRHRDARR